jgi:uncharacterized membrane protein (DUF4010 family)
MRGSLAVIPVCAGLGVFLTGVFSRTGDLTGAVVGGVVTGAVAWLVLWLWSRRGA